MIRKKIFISIVLLFLLNIFIVNGYDTTECPTYTLENCVNGKYNSAVNLKTKKIRYNGNSNYEKLIRKAASTWNSLGKVYIEEYYGTEKLDLDIIDIYDVNRDIEWAGRFYKYHWVPSKIKLNKTVLEGGNFTENNKLKLITHEFGHALGLAHSNSIHGNIMRQGLSDQTWLGEQDKKDYNYLWK